MRIIYEDTEGVKVVIPAIEDIDAVIEKAVPQGVEYDVVAASAIPEDRYFRNAWKKSGAAIGVDMVKAQGIHMGHIRSARDKKLGELDVAYIKADEDGNSPLKQQIAAEKKRLRDLPQTFDLAQATTPEELKALWPEGI